MTIRAIRAFFLLLSGICGYYLASDFTGVVSQQALIGASVGIGAAVIIILLEMKLKGVSLSNLSAAAFGLLFGFFMAWMVSLILKLIPMSEYYYSLYKIIFTLVFCYLGMVIALKGKDEFNIIIPYVKFRREDMKEQLYVMDTSVIIDGRVAAICEAGFLEGRLVVPRFVLQELQQVADSADDEKRTRGRRGLDMVELLKKIDRVELLIHDERLPDIKEVDAKLVRLSKMLDCPILTNDFNLNKVAKIEGVRVLNINDLVNALRPVVFPGERMSVQIKREGKEKNQGIAFLDDGTMIVVDDARKLIGKNVNVVISSVLQTSAGRMIFANMPERPVEKPEPRRLQKPNRRPQKPDNRAQKPSDRPQRKESVNVPKTEDKAQTPDNTDQKPDDRGQNESNGSERQEEVRAPQTEDTRAPQQNAPQQEVPRQEAPRQDTPQNEGQKPDQGGQG